MIQINPDVLRYVCIPCVDSVSSCLAAPVSCPPCLWLRGGSCNILLFEIEQTGMITVPWALEVELYHCSIMPMFLPCARAATGCLPPPGDLRPWCQGADQTGPGFRSWLYTVSQCFRLLPWTGARRQRTSYQGHSPYWSSPCLTAAGNKAPSPARARACLACLPQAISIWNLSPSRLAMEVAWGGSGSCQLGTRQRTQVRLLLGPAWPVLLSQLDILVAWPWQPATGLRAWTQWKFESCSLSALPNEMMRTWELLFWFVRHFVLMSMFPSTIPIHNLWVEIFVDSYHDFYSDLILHPQVAPVNNRYSWTH